MVRTVLKSKKKKGKKKKFAEKRTYSKNLEFDGFTRWLIVYQRNEPNCETPHV